MGEEWERGPKGEGDREDDGKTSVGEVFLCIEYFDTNTLLFVYQLQIPDTLRERNESFPDIRYIHR